MLANGEGCAKLIASEPFTKITCRLRCANQMPVFVMLTSEQLQLYFSAYVSLLQRREILDVVSHSLSGLMPG